MASTGEKRRLLARIQSGKKPSRKFIFGIHCLFELFRQFYQRMGKQDFPAMLD